MGVPRAGRGRGLHSRRRTGELSAHAPWTRSAGPARRTIGPGRSRPPNLARMTDARWQDVARATGLLGADGVPRATVFAEMSALAARTGAVNLGQGFPDVDGPASVAPGGRGRDRGGANQYPPGPGIPELRRGDRRAPASARYGLRWDPDSRGARHGRRDRGPRGGRARAGRTRRRGAHARAVLRLLRRGDRDGRRDPHDGARCARRPTASGSTWTRWPRRSPTATRLVLVNTPHNPTGTVLTRDELAAIARLAQRARRDRGDRRGVRAPRCSRRVGTAEARADRDAARAWRSGR